MKTKVVYVLVSNPYDYFYEQCFISILSLKHTTPNVHIVLVCDDKTRESLKGVREEIIPYLSDIKTIKFEDSINAIERSRRLKVNLRTIISGDFLYIDCDTLIIDDISEIDNISTSIAAVLDGHHKLSGHPMRSYFASQNAHLKYNFLDEENYFSGGVIYAKDDEISKKLYLRWNENYSKSVKNNIFLDEPSLCLSNMELSHPITELDGAWNCQVRFGALFIAKAKILHFCSKKNMPVNILSSKEFLLKVKECGLKTPYLHHYIKNWQETMPETLVISTGFDSFFNLTKDYEQARKEYINNEIKSNIYIPKITSIAELYRYLRNNILGRINCGWLSKILYKEKLGIPFYKDEEESLNKKIYKLAFTSDISRWAIYADKIAVREYVKSKGWETILPRVYKIWSTASEIDFADLPQSFVLKCNHDNGSTIVVMDRYALDISFIRKYYNGKLKKKFGITSAEPHYKFIQPVVFAEELIDNDSKFSDSLVSYKFFVINGKTKYCQVVYDSKSYERQRSIIYNINNWMKCEGFIIGKEGNQNIPRPKTLETMIKIAESLSDSIPFARIDLYEFHGDVYFSEITLMPSAGRITNFSKAFLKELGKNIKV